MNNWNLGWEPSAADVPEVLFRAIESTNLQEILKGVLFFI